MFSNYSNNTVTSWPILADNDERSRDKENPRREKEKGGRKEGSAWSGTSAPI